jgi:endonuclease YncB( thermonuclease family)
VAGAALLLCAVIGIADGDTLSARCDDPSGVETLRVRLAEIDPPEQRQAFGERSRLALAAICLHKAATVKPQTRDRYGRTVARINCDGTDANTEMVRTGMAWVFDKYVTDRSLYSVQTEAQEAKRRLWADAAPMPPWEWRHGVNSQDRVAPTPPTIP